MDISKILPHKEILASKVHDAWWKEKSIQGYHPPLECPLQINFSVVTEMLRQSKLCEKCHPDMYPYKQLPDNVREYDKVAVQTVLDAIKTL